MSPSIWRKFTLCMEGSVELINVKCEGTLYFDVWTNQLGPIHNIKHGMNLSATLTN